MSNRLLRFFLLVLPLLALLSCAAKASRQGSIVRQLADGFVLQEPSYPQSTVHVSPSTQFRCGKRELALSDLRSNEFVAVEGGYRPDGSVEAMKVTMLRKSSYCTPTSVNRPLQTYEAPESKLLLGLLIDTSWHQKKVIQFEREALNSLAEQFEGIPTESFVIAYGNNLRSLQDWTPSETGLKAASSLIELDAETGRDRQTLLYDAINTGLLKLGSRSHSDSKALIVIGEGNDEGSTAVYSKIKRLATADSIQCFALLVADHNLRGGRVRHFGWYLDDLASSTGATGYDIEHSQKNLEKALRDVWRRVLSD